MFLIVIVSKDYTPGVYFLLHSSKKTTREPDMKTLSDRKLLEQIGKTIRRNRRQKKYSQENLSKALNTSQAAVCRYEKGQTNLPVLTLKHIAEECSFDIVDFFIEIERPSAIYKRIVSQSGLMPEIPDKADAEFDKLLCKPENIGPMKVLYHISEIAKSIGKSIDIDLSMIARESIMKQAKESQLLRLKAYFELFNNTKKSRSPE